ncbi:MAG: pantoate--beta-alanine ligase [Cyclobacteriaceae bacterium]
MLRVSNPKKLREILRPHLRENSVIGLVPTMGALHQGHLELIRSARESCDYIVVSLFVNPLQFNSKGDLDQYPRELNEDAEKLMSSGVDVLFCPTEEEMYQTIPKTNMSFGSLESVMEGSFRPGHFSGVGIIVSKLFNIVKPKKAFFGLKDLQQFMIIKSLIRDLSYDIELVGIPTVREENGLAMSSRNGRLSAEGIQIASNIYRTINKAVKPIRAFNNPESITLNVKEDFERIEGLELEYCELVNPETMCAIETYEGLDYVAICVAAHVEGIRLIDNLYLRLN